ncbi:unnamed protein product, partial [Tenebrio molitor]
MSITSLNITYPKRVNFSASYWTSRSFAHNGILAAEYVERGRVLSKIS